MTAPRPVAVLTALVLVTVPASTALASAPSPYVGAGGEKLVPDELGEFHRFGHAIAVDDGRAAISVQDDSGDGGIAVYEAQATGWTKTAWLDASEAVDDGAPEIGADVALDGDTLVAGAGGVDTNDTFEAGAAVVFQHTDQGWTVDAVLPSPDPDALDRFGAAVAVDGETIAVSEPEDTLEGEYNSNGAVHVYEQSAEGYQHVAELTPPDDADRERLGVTLELEGDTLVSGAPEDHTPNGTGAAYVFEDTGTAFEQTARLTAPEADGARQLGQALDLEGQTLLVGAPGPQGAICCPTPPSPAGQAHVFEDGSDGWTHDARLEPVTSARGASLGSGVALAGDRAFAGAPDAPRDTVTGVVSVFERTDSGWTESGRALSGDPASGDAFGDTLATADGQLLAAEPGDDEAGHQAGAVHVVPSLTPTPVTPSLG